MRVWRLARRVHPVLDGEGASRAGGRWNSRGSPVVYTAGSRALAALELLAYLNPGSEPADLELFEIEVPDDAPTHRVNVAELPPDWQTPRHTACASRGDTWVHSGEGLLLEVPSVMIPEEPNFLLNPAHPDARRARVVGSRSFSYDPRLRK
jgi:RES domain-containing protein